MPTALGQAFDLLQTNANSPRTSKHLTVFRPMPIALGQARTIFTPMPTALGLAWTTSHQCPQPSDKHGPSSTQHGPHSDQPAPSPDHVSRPHTNKDSLQDIYSWTDFRLQPMPTRSISRTSVHGPTLDYNPCQQGPSPGHLFMDRL